MQHLVSLLDMSPSFPFREIKGFSIPVTKEYICTIESLFLPLHPHSPSVKPDWKHIVVWMRKYLLNKYLLTCLVFAVILTFCGDYSLVGRIRRARQISAMQEEVDAYKQQTEQLKHDIQEVSSSPENLERYAREHYYMHADNEDVYIVEE